jgi:hypothetical protein
MEQPHRSDPNGAPPWEEWTGPHGRRDVPDLSAIIAIFEALRRAVPHELQEQFNALQRELLLTLRALIDWYLQRLEKPELEPKVEDIPIQ